MNYKMQKAQKKFADIILEEIVILNVTFAI